jgi:hypothetical protein
MQIVRRMSEGYATLLFILTLCTAIAHAQTSQTVLSGEVLDESGARIVGATVTLTDTNNVAKTAQTNNAGIYTISGLSPGSYTVHATATGFAAYEKTSVIITAKTSQSLDIKLTIEIRAEITINNPALSTDPENNSGAVVLKGSDIDRLSDDPDQLADDLRALAGAAEGPDSVQFYVDGFNTTRPPSKSSIREIRINANPFAADQETIGFGRVDIFTKPGSDQLHGHAAINFNDESLNSRSPFVATREPFQQRIYSASLSGPVIAKKASFFFDFERREIDDNAYVVAIVLDSALNPTELRETVLTPQRRTNFSGRFDYQLHPNHTLVARYNRLHNRFENAGVGEFSLPSRAYETSSTEHIFNVTETAVLSPSALNETRFQYMQTRRDDVGDNTPPTINVQGAFIDGGAQIGFAFNDTKRYDLQNFTTLSRGNHTWKFGGRLRGVTVTDNSPNNFGGTFIFTSLEQYRQVLQGIPGVRPAQFTIAGDNPLAKVSRTDWGLFAQDDWRVRPHFTISLGLRYEAQTNVDDHVDLAPRIAFAWAPGAANSTKQPKTVIRGGFGIFYSRFGEDLTLQADRFNGINQQQFIVERPDFFPNVPSIADLTDAALPQTIWHVANDLKTWSTLRATMSIEREFPLGTRLSATYYYVRQLNATRALNINAPLPGTFVPGDPDSGEHPLGRPGNVFEFASDGRGTDNNLIFNVNSRLNKDVSLFGFYAISRDFRDSEGPYSFPHSSYDLAAEYARASYDFTSYVVYGANINLPRGFTFNILGRASSANRFNITTGRDDNGDAVFMDRPAFATDLSRPGVIVTRFGAFDAIPQAGETVIPRNFGKGNKLIQLNLRLSKVFNFSPDAPKTSATSSQNGRTNGTPATPARARPNYSLTFSIEAVNILNNGNFGPPIGNLRSPLFGESTTQVVTPRRFNFQLRLAF